MDVRRDGKAGGKSGFAGELDLMATPHADEALCRKYGRKVHAVPFTAATDDQGRLVEFAIQMNALGPDLGTARTTWHKVDGTCVLQGRDEPVDANLVEISAFALCRCPGGAPLPRRWAAGAGRPPTTGYRGPARYGS